MERGLDADDGGEVWSGESNGGGEMLAGESLLRMCCSWVIAPLDAPEMTFMLNTKSFPSRASFLTPLSSTSHFRIGAPH